MNTKSLSALALFIGISVVSFGNNFTPSDFAKPKIEEHIVPKVMAKLIYDEANQSCTVTLTSWVQIGFYQFSYTVTTTAATCAEAAKSATTQMNDAKSYFNQINIE